MKKDEKELSMAGFFSGIFSFIAFLLFLLFCGEIYTNKIEVWLQYGYTIPIFTLDSALDIEWVGLKKILSFFPVILVLFLASMILSGFFDSLKPKKDEYSYP